MNGLDLSNVVQIVLACLGIGSNCRRLLLCECLAYNWIQQFIIMRLLVSQCFLCQNQFFSRYFFYVTIDKSRLLT